MKVNDKRRTMNPEARAADARFEERLADDAKAAANAREAKPGEGSEGAVSSGASEAQAETDPEAGRDYLDDLRRLQAEFENYRKRMMKEQAEIATRATARVVEGLLPVLDNLERAIAHGEGGSGVALVCKELKEVLAGEGFEEIEAEGRPFDPSVHEAFQVVEDAGVTEPVVHEVFRRGYRHGNKVVRPAMVVVARPPEDRAAGTTDDDVAEG